MHSLSQAQKHFGAGEAEMHTKIVWCVSIVTIGTTADACMYIYIYIAYMKITQKVKLELHFRLQRGSAECMYVCICMYVNDMYITQKYRCQCIFKYICKDICK